MDDDVRMMVWIRVCFDVSVAFSLFGWHTSHISHFFSHQWALLNFLLPDIFASAEQFDEWFDLEIDDWVWNGSLPFNSFCHSKDSFVFVCRA